MSEAVLNILFSLLTNCITILADRYDSAQRTKFEERKTQIKANDILQIITVESLKTIKVDSREVDKLKVLLSDDIFGRKLANLFLGSTFENESVRLIADEVRKSCAYSGEQSLSIEPHIKEFVTAFYNKVLKEPSLSPLFIIKEIDEARRRSQKEHEEIAGSLEGLHKKFDSLNSRINNSQTVSNAFSEPLDSSVASVGATLNTSREESRVDRLLRKDVEKALAKLNSFFKTRTDEIKQIQKSRDFRKAMELYEAHLAEADELIDEATILGIYLDCALCSVNIDDLIAANKWLEKAEQIEPNDKRTLAIRGLYYYELNDKEKSKEYAGKALSVDEFYHLALMLLAATELESGTGGEIVLDRYLFDKGKSLKDGFQDEHLAVIYRTIGQCYLKDNATDEAIGAFEKSLSLDAIDDATLSLLGFAYLKKAIGPHTSVIHFHEKLSEAKEALVIKAIGLFNKSLELAAIYQSIKQHVSTRANLSTCYMLLGQYDKAYDVADISLGGYEELLKSRAAAAYYKGSYVESAELLSQVKDSTGQDIINEALALLNSTEDYKEKKALAAIDRFLEQKTVDVDDSSKIEYLKFQILLAIKDKDNAFNILNKLKSSTLPEWQKEAALGNYWETFDDHDKAVECYKLALGYPDIEIPGKIFIAYYYFQREDYNACFDVCSSISYESIQSDSEIFQLFLHITVVASFKLSKFDECQRFISYGKQQKRDDLYLNEIAAAIYWQNDELEKARGELLFVLDKRERTQAGHDLSALGLVSLLLCDFSAANSYFEQATLHDDFYNNSGNVINCINAFIVMGNKIVAKQIFKTALEAQFENKEDAIHKFAPTFYLRENAADLFAKYAVQFNNRHGDTDWLWKKDIEKDKEELREIFSEMIRQSNEAKQFYINNPLPLAFLTMLIRRRQLIHLWRFNREYALPLYLESGNPIELGDEISLLDGKKRILVDYTALLSLQEAGSEYLWMLDKAFDEIIIYRPMYVSMLTELLAEENDNLREILNFMTSTKKIRFIKKLEKINLNILDKNWETLIPEVYGGIFQVAQENRLPMLLGEVRLRGFASFFNMASIGVRAFLEFSNKNKMSDEEDISKAIISFIKKDCQFISFNKEALEYLLIHYTEDEFKIVLDKLRTQLFLPYADLDSFFAVYLGFILKCVGTGMFNSRISYFIEATINDSKKLTFRALNSRILSSLTRLEYLSEMKRINGICLGYIYLLLKGIYSANISYQARESYLAVVRKNANLAYWYEERVRDVPVIQFVFEAAQKKSRQK